MKILNLFATTLYVASWLDVRRTRKEISIYTRFEKIPLNKIYCWANKKRFDCGLRHARQKTAKRKRTHTVYIIASTKNWNWRFIYCESIHSGVKWSLIELIKRFVRTLYLHKWIFCEFETGSQLAFTVEWCPLKATIRFENEVSTVDL